MAKVFIQIVSDIEIDAKDLHDGIVCAKLIASKSHSDLEAFFRVVQGGRVLETYSPTKDWQIGAQVALGQPFNPPEVGVKIGSFEIKQISFAKKDEAQNVISELQRIAIKYGFVSVSDFYDLCGIITHHEDSRWGWKDKALAGLEIQGSEGSWKIVLPSPMSDSVMS